MNTIIDVKIPAKLMLFGEYHVLDGGTSLTVTPDCYMTVRVRSGLAGKLSLNSDLWKTKRVHSTGSAGASKGKPRYLSLLETTALSAMNAFSLQSADIAVTSGWKVSDGLGSSSALRLGIWFGLYALSGWKPDDSQSDISEASLKILRDVWEDQKRHQGFASGYDLASQFLGGLVTFSYSDKSWPLSLQREVCVKNRLNQYIHVFVGGKGAPTGATGKSHMSWMKQKNLNGKWNEIQARGVSQMSQFLAGSNHEELVSDLLKTFRQTMCLMEQSPIFPAAVAEILNNVSGLGETWAWKTTGAGGEDALILFGGELQCDEAIRKLQNAGWKKLLFSCPDKGILIQRLGSGEE